MTLYSGRVHLIASSLLSRFSFCTRLALVLAECVRHITRVYKKHGQIGRTGLSVDVYGYCSWHKIMVCSAVTMLLTVICYTWWYIPTYQYAYFTFIV